MDFDEIYKSTILSEETVLQLVDEYTLYCFYSNITPLIAGKAYSAPYYRKDNYPSFSIFESKHPVVQYMWKDHATGEAGTVFDLIAKIEGLNSLNEVFARINDDFALGYNTTNPVRRQKITWYDVPTQNEIKIRIQEQPFTKTGTNFWEKLYIDHSLLALYNVTQVKFFWMYEGQDAPTTAPDPTFSYRIGKYYQLYSPLANKLYKFRNDLPENYFFGYLQLPETGDKLVIDKSSKDVIFCRRLGLNAVAGKSETTMIPHFKILELKDRFEEVYLTLDPDPAGRKQTERYLEKYSWMKPRFLTEAKDKTDLCTLVGFEEASRIIHKMLK